MVTKPAITLLAALAFASTWASPAGLVGRPASQTFQTPASAAASAKSRKPRLPIHRTATAPVRYTLPKTWTPSPTGPKIAVFNGLNQPGLNATDNGINQGTPPDTTGSIGPSHYVETVNTVIGVYKRSDLSLVSKATFNSWLAVSQVLCDPQIQWDSSSQRWLYVVLGCNFGVDKFFFGWSKTPDPSNLATGWCRFSKVTAGVLPDYPKLGHSSKYMLVGTNDFSDAGMNPFITAQIFWMKTPAPGVITCTPPAVQSVGTQANRLKNGDGVTLTGTPVPVNTTTNTDLGYVVSAYDASGPPPTVEHKLAVWHLDGNGVLKTATSRSAHTQFPSRRQTLAGRRSTSTRSTAA